MKINVIEKQCLAKVGLSIEFSNSECSSIERVANKLNDAVKKAVKQAEQMVSANKESGCSPATYKQPADVPVVINLDMAMRICWLLGNFANSRESDLFVNADNMSLVTLAEINGEQSELTELSPTTQTNELG